MKLFIWNLFWLAWDVFFITLDAGLYLQRNSFSDLLYVLIMFLLACWQVQVTLRALHIRDLIQHIEQAA